MNYKHDYKVFKLKSHYGTKYYDTENCIIKLWNYILDKIEIKIFDYQIHKISLWKYICLFYDIRQFIKNCRIILKIDKVAFYGVKNYNKNLKDYEVEYVDLVAFYKDKLVFKERFSRYGGWSNLLYKSEYWKKDENNYYFISTIEQINCPDNNGGIFWKLNKDKQNDI